MLPDALSDTVFDLFVLFPSLHNPLVLPALKPLVQGQGNDGAGCFIGLTILPLRIFDGEEGDE